MPSLFFTVAQARPSLSQADGREGLNSVIVSSWEPICVTWRHAVVWTDLCFVFKQVRGSAGTTVGTGVGLGSRDAMLLWGHAGVGT